MDLHEEINGRLQPVKIRLIDRFRDLEVSNRHPRPYLGFSASSAAVVQNRPVRTGGFNEPTRGLTNQQRRNALIGIPNVADQSCSFPYDDNASKDLTSGPKFVASNSPSGSENYSSGEEELKPLQPDTLHRPQHGQIVQESWEANERERFLQGDAAVLGLRLKRANAIKAALEKEYVRLNGKLAEIKPWVAHRVHGIIKSPASFTAEEEQQDMAESEEDRLRKRLAAVFDELVILGKECRELLDEIYEWVIHDKGKGKDTD